MREINLGMVGSGEIAKSHLLAYSSLPVLYGAEMGRVRPIIVGEKNEELGRSAAAKFGFDRWTVGWKDVVENQEVDFVDIVAPSFLHKQIALDAIERGKNVFCEKPLAPSAKDAQEMYEAAKNAGVINMVGFNHRWLPAVAYAKSLIDSNYIGRIYQMRCFYLEDFGTNAEAPLIWRYSRDLVKAGSIIEMGAHVIDILRYFMAQEPSSVCATSRTFVTERPLESKPSVKGKVEVDDTTMALLKFGSGAIAEIATSWVADGHRAPHFEFEVNGSQGSLYYDLERPHELLIYSSTDVPAQRGFKTVRMGPEHPGGSALPMTQAGTGLGFEESFVGEMREMVDAIQKGRTAAPSFYDGWKAHQIIDAIVLSAAKDAWVTVG